MPLTKRPIGALLLCPPWGRAGTPSDHGVCMPRRTICHDMREASAPVHEKGNTGVGGKHGLGTPPVFTPTLALPRLRGREKTDRRGSRKLNDPVRPRSCI